MLRYPLTGTGPRLAWRLEWIRGLLYIYFGSLHRFRFSGLENVPESGPLIIASNHPSYFDPFLISAPLRRPLTFMAWDALWTVPMLGRLAGWLGAFPVSLKQAGRNSIETANRILSQGRALTIFPEGERSHTGELGKLRAGPVRLAIKHGAPIVPVSIQGAYRCWNRHRRLPRPGPISIVYHPPIRPPADAASLARPERRVIETQLTARLEQAIRSRMDPREKL